MVLNRSQIEELLPHRDPMLLVDAVEELVPGESAKATFYVSPEREIFRGHFPGDPVLPGVYTVECMAQTADILLLSVESYRGLTPLFLGINNVRFRRKVLPGDTITMCARLLSQRPEKLIATCVVEVYRGEELAAEGEVTLAMR